MLIIMSHCDSCKTQTIRPYIYIYVRPRIWSKIRLFYFSPISPFYQFRHFPSHNPGCHALFVFSILHFILARLYNNSIFSYWFFVDGPQCTHRGENSLYMFTNKQNIDDLEWHSISYAHTERQEKTKSK